MISLYIIGLEAGCLKFGDVIEKYEFFFDLIDNEDWENNVQTSNYDLLNFDIYVNSKLYEHWKSGEEVALTPIGLQTANMVSIYLGYLY